MSRRPATMLVRLPVTLRRDLDRLARRQRCSRNALVNDLARAAVDGQGSRLSGPQRKRANCRFR